MADPTTISTDLGVGIIPELDQKKHPEVYRECARLRSAIRNLALALDTYTGASAIANTQFNAGWVAYGSGAGLVSSASFTFDSVSVTLAAANLTTTSFKSSGTSLGFFSAVSSPVAQPTTAGAASTFVAGAGTAVNDASTFDGYTLKQVVKALRSLGLLA